MFEDSGEVAAEVAMAGVHAGSVKLCCKQASTS